jgi:hypothetical protein
LKRYEAAGFEGIKCQKILGKQPPLTKAQIQKIFHIVTMKNPLLKKFAFALWTRATVKELTLINSRLTSARFQLAVCFTSWA